MIVSLDISAGQAYDLVATINAEIARLDRNAVWARRHGNAEVWHDSLARADRLRRALPVALTLESAIRPPPTTCELEA